MRTIILVDLFLQDQQAEIQKFLKVGEMKLKDKILT